MRAAVLSADRPRLELAEVADPTPAPDQVVVRVTGCGICGSDLHVAGALAVPGTILGHEIAGVIEEVGVDAAEGWKPGAAVTARPFAGCGTCRHCRNDRPDHCPSFELLGFARPGGFAEYVALEAAELFRLPTALSAVDQALVEPLAVARRTVRRSGLQAGESVAVLGGGPIGLAVAMWARALGAGSVVVSDPVEVRRQLALGLGADAAVDPLSESVAAACAEAAGGEPPSVVIECSGRPGLIDQAMQLADVEGRVAVVGICTMPDQFFPWNGLHKEVDVRFSMYYGTEDFVDTIAALEDGRLEPAPMVTETIDLDGLPERFAELAARPDAGKVVLRP